jgi:TRAP-type C4-dicarboxylate transport system substrate-binding protein
MLRRLVLALAFAAFSFAATAARADEVRLIFGSTNPPPIPVNPKFFDPWAKQVNEAGKGVVFIDVRHDPAIANFLNYLDRTLNDVVQISWGIQSLLGPRFAKSAVIGLPLIADNATQPSVAYWRLYKSGLLDSEYQDIVPLMLFSFAHSGLHTAKAPHAPDDIHGLKIITGSRIIADVVSGLGAAPVTFPLSEAYQALQRGTADGIMTPWTAFQPFKLAEVTKYHVDTWMGASPGAMFMARKRYDALPAAARKILDEYSGEEWSRKFGAFWDSEQTLGRELVEKIPGHTIVKLNPAQEATWKREADIAAANWAKSVPDGEKLLAAFKAELAKVKAEAK